jgi:histidyl-tRNA synthetase
MTDSLTQRLNEILPRITSDDFLGGRGLGNEIAFYIFDYPPEEELRIRQHVQFLLEHIPKRRPGLRVKHINLFDSVIDHLRNRNLLDRCFQKQKDEGDEALLKALSAPLHETRIAQVFAEEAQPDQHDLILVSGVGSVFPLVRTHTLLNNLQLRLFDKLKNANYYRAFKLVP